MADLKFKLVATQQVLSLNTQTLLQGTAPTNIRVKILGISVGFHGTVNTNEPVTIQLLRQTTTGTSTICTPVKVDPSIVETITTAGAWQFTAEPTAGDILDSWPVHPQTGIVLPLEYIASGGTRFAIRAVTPTNTVGCEVSLLCEQ